MVLLSGVVWLLGGGDIARYGRAETDEGAGAWVGEEFSS